MAFLAARRATISNCLWAFSRLQRCGLVDLNGKGEEHLSLPKITRVARQSALAITKIHLRGLTCSATPNMSRDHKEEHELFESWISKHGRVYKDTEEKQHRFNIFKDNLVFLDAQNKYYGPDCSIEGLDIFSDESLDKTYDEYHDFPSDDDTAIDQWSSGIPPEIFEFHQSKVLKSLRTLYNISIFSGFAASRDVQDKSQYDSTGRHIKVHKQGTTLCRCVDLVKFDDYDGLIAELDQLFEFHGELIAPEKNWVLVYTDYDNDMMLVGDDHWLAFRCIVWRIFIFTREEVQKMNIHLTSLVE